jgi:DNA-binding MarR family transcriptional regulator
VEDEIDRYNREILREYPFLDLEVEGAVHRITSLFRFLDKNLGEVLIQNGLNMSEYKLLIHLRNQGPPYRLSPSRLAQRQQTSSGAMTNRLDRLERSGLVRRSPDPDDRRGVLVALTDEGNQLLDKAVKEQAKREGELLDALDAGEKEQLNALLRKLLASFRK